MALLPGRQRARQLEGRLAVPDEVVVDDEDLLAPPQPPQRVDLRDELRRRLGARPPPVNRDDVAELAFERAPARELDRHRRVGMSRSSRSNRGTGLPVMSGLSVDPIQPRRRTGFEPGRYLTEAFVHFPDNDVIGQRQQRFGLAARVRAADDRSRAQFAAARENVVRVEALGVHGAEHDQVRALEVRIRQPLERAVDQSEPPARRTERRPR